MQIDTGIRAIGRGLRVLQAINHHRSISMMEIARQCELPYPTTCRIVETLIEERMVERETTRKHYRPTALVKTLSVGYQPGAPRAEAARLQLKRAVKQSRWAWALARRLRRLRRPDAASG